MAYNDTPSAMKGPLMTETTTNFNVIAQPTTQEQLVSAGIGVAATIVVSAVSLATTAAFFWILDKNETRKDKAQAKNSPIINQE